MYRWRPGVTLFPDDVYVVSLYRHEMEVAVVPASWVILREGGKFWRFQKVGTEGFPV